MRDEGGKEKEKCCDKKKLFLLLKEGEGESIEGVKVGAPNFVLTTFVRNSPSLGNE
jgi:hypothetical protein